MSIDEIAKTLGIPGVLICVWYLLETQRGRRAEKADDARNKIEEAKVAALTLGFQSIIAKLDTHQHDEFEHHAQTREAIVGMHTALANHLDFTPPPQEPPKPPRKSATPPTPPKGTYFLGRPSPKGGDR